MKYAIIENDEIINIIEATSEFIKENKLKAFELGDEDLHIGAKLIEDKWVNQVKPSKEQSIDVMDQPNV